MTENIVRVRGLPWSSNEEDVRKFFNDCETLKQVHFTYSKEGRPSGEAYLEFGTPEDVERAVAHHRMHMGQRYIEVFNAKRNEMDYVLQRSGKPSSGNFADTVVRLRGLPYNCTKEDVIDFFKGLDVTSDRVVFGSDRNGRASGEGFVHFDSPELTERALERHMDRIGHRYIEVFRSSVEEMDRVTTRPMVMMGGYGRQSGGRPGPYSLLDAPLPGPGFGREPSRGYCNTAGTYRGGIPGSMYGGDPYVGSHGSVAPPRGYYNSSPGPNIYARMPGRWGPSHTVHMRGLPFKATANDVMEFFYPIKILNIRILFDERGRATGEADVEFNCLEDVKEAMKKHRDHMGDRYIELFAGTVNGGSQPAAVPRMVHKMKMADAAAGTSRSMVPRYGHQMSNPIMENRAMRGDVVVYPGLSQFSAGGGPADYSPAMGSPGLALGGGLYQSPC